MGVYDVYQDRISVHGRTKRNASLIREKRCIDMKLPENLSYTTVEIFPSEYGYNIDEDKVRKHHIIQKVAIINSDNYEEKYMYSMPGEEIRLGALIHWMHNHWLVIERDVNTTVYTRVKLLQCNHLLTWLNKDHEKIRQWCVVEDGTKLKRAV